MPETIRFHGVPFHTDESAHGAIAPGLRRLGIDVTTPQDAGLVGATDEQHLAFALAELRVLFAQDEDFLVLHAAGALHAGIVYGRQESCSIGDAIRALKFLWAHFEPEEMTGRVEYVTRWASV